MFGEEPRRLPRRDIGSNPRIPTWTDGGSPFRTVSRPRRHDALLPHHFLLRPVQTTRWNTLILIPTQTQTLLQSSAQFDNNNIPRRDRLWENRFSARTV